MPIAKWLSLCVPDSFHVPVISIPTWAAERRRGIYSKHTRMTVHGTECVRPKPFSELSLAMRVQPLKPCDSSIPQFPQKMLE